MRHLGLDFGTKTVGISISDKTGLIATSLTTLRYDGDYFQTFENIKTITDEKQVEKIVLGMPKNMNNTNGQRALETLEFKKDLENYINIEVVLEDERLTTSEATNTLIQADLSRKKRKQVVDSVAATIILQNYLNKLKR